FAEIEAGVTRLIAQAFDVDFDTEHRAIKHADMVALATEKRDLMPNSAEAWSYLAGIAPLAESIDPLPPAQAKAAFLAAWAQVG
ncbi:MAG: phosphohydrolase, partial [Burkholderiales bacterium]|nr:phosphohydrolase [Burkholderiales bacterium]